MFRIARLAGAWILVSLLARGANGQVDSAAGARTLDSLLRANMHVAQLRDGALSSAGHDFLIREMASAQFVAIGERHGIREIPQIVSALLTELHARYGFNHLATENGELLSERLFRSAAARNGDSVFAFARRYPGAIEFAGDEDLAMIGSAARLLEATPDAVWGIDQEFGALHLLDELRTLPAPAHARRAVDSLTVLVRVAESRRFNDGGRHWLAVDAHPEVFRQLRATYGAEPDPRVDRILASLETSAQLYLYGRTSTAAKPTSFLSNDEREMVMKRAFAKHYANAVARGERYPRVILKMGSAHLGRGQSPFGPFTVGNFVSDLAIANGGQSFHLAVLAHNPPGDSAAPALWAWSAMRPLANAASFDGITVFDLRPLRAYLYSNRLGPVEADLRRTIFGYDAIALIGGAHNAAETITRR